MATLAGKGYFPQLRFLSIKRDVAETEGVLAEAEQSHEVAQASLAEAVSRRDGAERDRHAAVLTELAEATQNRDRALQELRQAEAELRNRVILAPADGIVEGLIVAGPGQAVRPNDEIMKIVPSEGGLVLEALVSTSDIGHVHIGQPARIKVLAFDYVRYGTLDGVVQRIAADAVPDDRGHLICKVEVQALKDHLGPEPGLYALAPGMAAQIELAVGRRSILSYLTDRMLNLANEAFKER